MARSKAKEAMDKAMAEELNRERSPFVLMIKHVIQLEGARGGFVFAYTDQGHYYYDVVPLWSETLGQRLKPPRYPLPPVVTERLAARGYARWYYYDDHYLYPINQCKTTHLYEAFYFIDVEATHANSTRAVCHLDPFPLRKKAVQASTTWTPYWEAPPTSSISKVSVRRRPQLELA